MDTETAMKANEALWNNLMELSTVAGMNQRYAQHMLSWWEFLGTVIDVAVVITTMVTLAIGVAAYYKPDALWPVFPWWDKRLIWKRFRVDGIAAIVAVPAAIAGVCLIVVPVSDSIRHYNSMFQSWSDLRQDIDSTIADADAAKLNNSDDKEYLERRFRDLLAKKNSLNAREPAPNKKLLDHYLDVEEQSRGVADAAVSPARDAGGVNDRVGFAIQPNRR
jgi:hypothetical protein